VLAEGFVSKQISEYCCAYQEPLLSCGEQDEKKEVTFRVELY